MNGQRLKRGGQCPFRSPSARNTSEQTARTHSEFLRPLTNGQSFAIEFKIMITACIVRLLFSCCPSAIVGRIATVIINAIYAVLSGWSLAHVGDELLKAITPLFAYRNASPAVCLISLRARVFTPGYHRAPNIIFRRFRHSMRAFVYLCPFSFQASAAFCSLVDKLAGLHNRMISAFALAQPHRFAYLASANQAKHTQTVKLFTNQVVDSIVSKRDDLRNLIGRIIFGVHQKSFFWWLIQGRFTVAAWYLRVLYSCNYSTNGLNWPCQFTDSRGAM